MDSNDNRLNSFYHHHQQQQQQQQQPLQQSNSPSKADGGGSTTLSPVMYTQSVQPADAAVRRKRGRPRKYGTPEQALAAKKATSFSASAQGSHKKKDTAGNVIKKLQQQQQQVARLGNAGQGFTAHIINVTAGEDVSQRILLFMQQSGRQICILSASGSISNASLRQPATSGGGIMYEGRFELVSLSGSYVHTENGGRSGGLSVCLSDTNSQVIGGGVGGPLVAAGPVQVIVGSFLIQPNKDNGGGIKGDCVASHLTSSISNASMQGGGYRPAVESAGRVQGRSNDDLQNIAGSPFMIQSQNMHTMPPQAADWMGGSDARSGGSYEFLGRVGRAPFRSPENGDYNQMAD